MGGQKIILGGHLPPPPCPPWRRYCSLSWQFLHMRDRKRVRYRQRSLLLRFPAQIETSASREVILAHMQKFLRTY